VIFLPVHNPVNGGANYYCYNGPEYCLHIVFKHLLAFCATILSTLTDKYSYIQERSIMGDIFKIIGDLGFPVAAALAGGYFVYLTIRLLLQGVLGSVKGMAGIITALDNRVKTMNHDVVRIDTIVSNALGLRPDVDRIARADGKNDARRD
jgi:hypothetical protein